MTKVFIDGSAGTTGLRIKERLQKRNDIELVVLPEQSRKDISARQYALNCADIAFLCLPDAAAVEAVSLVENENTVIIDTSTAHRTAALWTYGFPELYGYREKIRNSKRIANPGCHATGFISLIHPLVKAGIIPDDILLTCFSVTGYSGGGKKMIAEYQSSDRDGLLDAPRQYGLAQTHKHLPEMSVISGIKNQPVFCPIVSDFYSGMEVTVPLFASQIKGDISDISEVYNDCYNTELVFFEQNTSEQGFISASAMAGRDDMQISVYGNDERILLVSRFDNLGKGASGAAIQNMNIILGIDETVGLNYGGKSE